VYVLGGRQCCLCSCPCVCVGGNVAAVHVNVYVVWDGSLLPVFMSMYMC